MHFACAPLNRRDLLAFALVFSLALAPRIAWVLLVRPDLSMDNDTGIYDFFGQRIAAGDGYVHPDGTPAAFWPVGYPATLGAVYAVFGHSVDAARLLNVLADSATAGLVYLLARRWLAPRPAAVPGLIYAVLPGAIGFTGLLLSESLFTFLLTASLAHLAWMRQPSTGRAVVFGVLVAAATYVRGVAVGLPLVAVFWLLSSGERFRPAVRSGGVAALVLVALSLPWAVRNSVRLGTPVYLSTNAGIDFWMGHHEGADGGLRFDQLVGLALPYDDLPRSEWEVEVSRAGLRKGLSFAATHPADEARLAWAKVRRLYEDDADALRWTDGWHGESETLSSSERRTLFVLFDSAWLALAVFSIAGLTLGLRRKTWGGPTVVVLAYWTLAHVVFFAEPRFHAPVLPVMALLAGTALVAAFERLRVLSRPRSVSGSGRR